MFDNKKKVMVVDDSVFARKIVSDIINNSSELKVVGTAVNGREALSLIDKLNPDVITMDVEMPELNGIETLKFIMENRPTPVVMVSSLTVSGARESIEALRLGAIDIMAKPHGSHSIGLTAQRADLIAKLVAAADVDMSKIKPVSARHNRRVIFHSSIPVSSKFPIVIIASSTGGPRALRTVVPDLTTEAGAAYVIVQHLPEGFSKPLANDLNNMTELNVREGSEGDRLGPNDLIFAKAGFHNVFDKSGTLHLTTTPPLWGVRPSADATMVSAVPVFGPRLVGVVLTGMGRDGANGIGLIKEAGGSTIAEHQSSCVVYGMPRVAIESGFVDIIAPLQQIAEAVNATVIQTAKDGVRKRTAA